MAQVQLLQPVYLELSSHVSAGGYAAVIAWCNTHLTMQPGGCENAVPRRQDPIVGFIKQAAAGSGVNLTLLGCSNASKWFNMLDIKDVVNISAPSNCCKRHSKFSNNGIMMDSNQASVNSMSVWTAKGSKISGISSTLLHLLAEILGSSPSWCLSLLPSATEATSGDHRCYSITWNTRK